jgi:hypothetical protein
LSSALIPAASIGRKGINQRFLTIQGIIQQPRSGDRR